MNLSKQELKAIVKEAIDEGEFRVSNKAHFQHHEFIANVMASGKTATGIIGKVLLVALVGSFITIFFKGFN